MAGAVKETRFVQPWLKRKSPRRLATELVQFPTDDHNDQVDVTSGAGIVLALTGASGQAQGVRIS